MTALAPAPTAPKVSADTMQELKALNRNHEYFYARVLGERVGTCPTTLGYVGKNMEKGKLVYFACRELYSMFHSFQWHVCFLSDIEKLITQPAHKIKRYASLASALNYLNS